jgi:co-chaperonin GroES (HSP10)
MGEAKRRDEAAEAVLLDPKTQIEPISNYLLVKLTSEAKVTENSRLIVPDDLEVEKNKKNYGAVINTNEFLVEKVGPDVVGIEPGMRVVVTRKAIAFEGTAVNYTANYGGIWLYIPQFKDGVSTIAAIINR